ncbi:MAG: hypothetical protein ACO3JL_18825, partial [Myxococcota bacterium]
MVLCLWLGSGCGGFTDLGTPCNDNDDCPSPEWCSRGRCSRTDPPENGPPAEDAAVPRCGDGIVNAPTESCDDGN